MPELPDVTVYIEALERRVVGQALERVHLASPFVLRSFDPARYPAATLRAHAETFAPARFIERLRAIVTRVRDEALTPA